MNESAAPAGGPGPTAEEAARSTTDPPVDSNSTGSAPANEDRQAEQLMDLVRPRERPRRRRPSTPAGPSVDILRKWVEGDDRAMEAWIRSAPAPMPAGLREPLESGGAAAETVPVPPEPETGGRPRGVPAASPVPRTPAIAEREKIVLKWLTDLLERSRSEQFDPASVLEELQEMNLKLYEERGKRARLEDEVEQVKRGAIAVIKYVRSREAIAREESLRDKEAEIADLKLKLLQGNAGAAPAASAEREAEIEARLSGEFAAKEEEMRHRIAQLEGEVRELKEEARGIVEREALLDAKAKELPDAVAKGLRQLESREKELANRETEVRMRFEEVRAATDDRSRQKDLLKLKEKQLSEWELQLRTLKQASEIEARTLEQARRELDETGIPLQEGRRIEELKADLTRREDDLRNREMLLHKRIEELETRLASSDEEGTGKPMISESPESRAPTGVRRLDDLMFGGLPRGTQVLVNGPAHTGKELLARLFVAEGLRRGIPAIWVVTDKTYTQVREEMTGLLPTYKDLEQKGLVRYVDLYSRSLGVTQTEAGVRLLQTTDRGVLEQLTQAVSTYSQELKEKAPSYRLVFESVSTMTAYMDTMTSFRFLQPFTGRRKLDGAEAYYLLETGMHSESDLETLEHMVDGSLNLKVEQLKTFLSVRGITDVQSRAWVGYTFSKRAFSLGSFSLDHIR
ncbi:MAG: hypothetical protein L3J93_01655 [Thermoplasmata archaeon]|nr:hypothetical protein [Thermoplasmata archaeon]